MCSFAVSFVTSFGGIFMCGLAGTFAGWFVGGFIGSIFGVFEDIS